MTQLNANETFRLAREISMGERAQRFYDEFVEEFVKEKRELVFQTFIETDPLNTAKLTELRQMIGIINIFDYEIKSYIQTGQMAQMMINEADKN